MTLRPTTAIEFASGRIPASPLTLALALACLLTATSCSRKPAAPAFTLPDFPPAREIAHDPRGLVPPPELPPAADEAAAYKPRPKGSVTFSKHIAPIVYAKCAGCHRPDGMAPFSLVAYADAKGRSGQMGVVTRSRYMPPWHAEHGYNEFDGERRLTGEEVGLISQWAEDGAPEGNPGDLPPAPKFPPGWQLGTPDLEIPFPHTYDVRGDGGDIFRNFVIPDASDTTRYVRGMEFRTNGPKVVHHAEFRIDETENAKKLDDADPLPGFEGMEAETAHYPEGYFLSWVPGKTERLEPQGRSWTLSAGTDFVVQLHLLPSGKPEQLKPTLALYFADGPPTEVAAFNLRLGSRAFDIPAGRSDVTIEDTYTLPVDVEVLSLLPHAHFLCRDMQGWAVLPDGTKKWLIRIKDWDFAWQDEYRYAAPFTLPKGTVLGMRYTFDNTEKNPRNPSHPPRPVSWGPRSSDEMADLWIRVRPRGQFERELLGTHHMRHRKLEDIAAHEILVRRRPDAGLHQRLARDYAKVGMMDRSVAHLRAAVSVAPENPDARFALGATLRAAGDAAGAIEHLQRAVEIDPKFAAAHVELAGVLSARGDREGATRALRTAAGCAADADTALLRAIAAAQFATRDTDGAVETLQRAASKATGDAAAAIRQEMDRYRSAR